MSKHLAEVVYGERGLCVSWQFEGTQSIMRKAWGLGTVHGGASLWQGLLHPTDHKAKDEGGTGQVMTHKVHTLVTPLFQQYLLKGLTTSKTTPSAGKQVFKHGRAGWDISQCNCVYGPDRMLTSSLKNSFVDIVPLTEPWGPAFIQVYFSGSWKSYSSLISNFDVLSRKPYSSLKQ